MRMKIGIVLFCAISITLVLGGITLVSASGKKIDYDHVATLADLDFIAYVRSLDLKGQEVIDFFKDIPVSKANKEIYAIYEKDGFQFYLDKYPKAPPFEGFQWKIGMGTETVCPLGKYPVKYPFSDYVPLEEGPIADAGKTYRIGYTIHGWEIPWLLNNTGGAVWEGDRHPNVKVVGLDAGWDDAKQARHIDTWIAQGFDGILVWPRTEAPMGPPVDRAIDAGIPVVTIDRQAGTDKVTHRITGNFPANGAQCAMYVVHQLLAETGKVEGTMVMIRQTLGGTADSMRTGHFLKVMSYFPGIKVVGNYHNNSSRTESFKQVQDALMANPKLDIIWSTSAPGSLGALEAIDMAKRWDSREGGRRIILISPDDYYDAIAAVRDGKIGTIAPYTGFLGDIGMRVMLRHLRGDKLPQDITTPDLVMVTQKKMNIFGLETVTPDQWFPHCVGPKDLED